MDYSEYYEILATLKTKQEMTQFIETRLINLLMHAYSNVAYYRKLFEEYQIVENGQINFLKFENIPILTKHQMREFHDDFLSHDYKKRKFYHNSSGGSTGEPINLLQDYDYFNWSNAFSYYYYYNLLNIDEPNAKKILLWGSERDLFKGSIGLKLKIYYWLTNTIPLNSFRMTESDMNHYISVINSYKPELIRGYAGSLYELSNYAKKHNLKLYQPKRVISSAETLRENMREIIEEQFNRKIFDFYGSREVGGMAAECEYGSMHMLFGNFIEILDENNKRVKVGEEGKVVVTNLFNYSMPLIRYEIGDMAILGPDTCECGSLLPTLKKITGRITDHFIKKDGTIVHGEYFTHLFYFKNWIKSFQVIQEDYERIRILIVRQMDENPVDIEDIQSKVILVMGKNCRVEWEFVQDIPKTATGKYLYTKSLISR